MTRAPSPHILCATCGAVALLRFKTLVITQMGAVTVPVHVCPNAECLSLPRACLGDGHHDCPPPPLMALTAPNMTVM